MHARTQTTKRGRAVSVCALRAVLKAKARNIKAAEDRAAGVRRYLREYYGQYLAE